MTEQVDATLIQPVLPAPPPPRTKWEREYRAFQRLLPELLATQRGKYVAVHGERVVDSDSHEMTLIMRVLSHLGNVDIHVGLVTDQPATLHRSGVVRNLSPSVA